MNKLNVLYEDNHIIVVVKEANIPTQKDSSNDMDMLSIVKQYIKEKYHKPGNVYLGLVHRLDRPVGGIMIFARTSKAASRLSEEVRNHTFKKTYLAVVNGILKEKNKELINYISKDKNNNSVITSEKNGKIAKLKYSVIEEIKEKNLSLLKIYLETGRHHQIRVQMSNFGHSLFGDQKYGVRGKGKQIRLWAYEVEFEHPTKKEKIKILDYPDWSMCKTIGLN